MSYDEFSSVVDRVKLWAAVGLLVWSVPLAADTYYVSPDARSGASGADRGHPMTWPEALEAVSSDGGGEILLAGGVYLFAGTDTVFRPAGEVTIRGVDEAYPVLDGCDLADCLDVEVKNRLSVTHVTFTRGARHGLSKAGPGELVLHDCVFIANATRSQSSGRGLFASGGVLRMNKCSFEHNALGVNIKHLDAGAVSLVKCRTSVEVCRFERNGYAGYGEWYSVSCILADSSALTVKDSVFADNRSKLGHNGGAQVCLRGHVSGSSFTNCVFAGNVSEGGKSALSGALVFNSTWNSKGWCEVVGCTFSNNVNQTKGAAAGFLLGRGQAKVVGCKFIGNDGPDIGVAEKDSAIVLSGTAFDREEKDAFAVFAGKIEKEK